MERHPGLEETTPGVVANAAVMWALIATDFAIERGGTGWDENEQGMPPEGQGPQKLALSRSTRYLLVWDQ